MDVLESVLQIADDEDIPVQEYAIGTRDGMALRDLRGGMAIAIHPNVTQGPRTRAARVVGHELGHCMTGSFYSKQFALPNVGQCERKATQWYVAVVVSPDDLERVLRQTDNNYWEAAEELGVDIDTVIEACDHHFGMEPAAIRAGLGIEKQRCVEG